MIDQSFKEGLLALVAAIGTFDDVVCTCFEITISSVGGRAGKFSRDGNAAWVVDEW